MIYYGKSKKDFQFKIPNQVSCPEVPHKGNACNYILLSPEQKKEGKDDIKIEFTVFDASAWTAISLPRTSASLFNICVKYDYV